MKIRSQHNALGVAVLASLTALPVTPVVLAQNLVDASVNFEVNNWRFAVFGRNLSDEDGYTHGYDVAGLWLYAAVRAPRTFGVEEIYEFGD